MKPTNILIDAKARIQVCDFGCARIVDAHVDTPQGGGRPMSCTVGALWYRAPELLREESHHSCAVDIWSLGCVVGELLSGKRVFSGADIVAQVNLYDNVDGALVGIESERMRSFVRLALTVEPSERPSAADLLEHESLDQFHSPEREPVHEGELTMPLREGSKYRAVDYRGAIYRHVIEKINIARQRIALREEEMQVMDAQTEDDEEEQEKKEKKKKKKEKKLKEKREAAEKKVKEKEARLSAVAAAAAALEEDNVPRMKHKKAMSPLEMLLTRLEELQMKRMVFGENMAQCEKDCGKGAKTQDQLEMLMTLGLQCNSIEEQISETEAQLLALQKRANSTTSIDSANNSPGVVPRAKSSASAKKRGKKERRKSRIVQESPNEQEEQKQKPAEADAVDAGASAARRPSGEKPLRMNSRTPKSTLNMPRASSFTLKLSENDTKSVEPNLASPRTLAALEKIKNAKKEMQLKKSASQTKETEQSPLARTSSLPPVIGGEWDLV